MNAIRSSLQRQLFEDDEERLSAIVSLVKIEGKDLARPAYFCLTQTTEAPVNVRIYLVKEDKEDSYRKKEKFQLRDVRFVGGYNPGQGSADFSITLSDRTLFLSAASREGKDFIIKDLLEAAARHCPSNNFLLHPDPDHAQCIYTIDSDHESMDEDDERMTDEQHNQDSMRHGDEEDEELLMDENEGGDGSMEDDPAVGEVRFRPLPDAPSTAPMTSTVVHLPPSWGMPPRVVQHRSDVPPLSVIHSTIEEVRREREGPSSN